MQMGIDQPRKDDRLTNIDRTGYSVGFCLAAEGPLRSDRWRGGPCRDRRGLLEHNW